MNVIVFRLELCPMCELLIKQLNQLDIVPIVKDMQNSESMAELLVDGVYTQNAPVLKIDDEYFYDNMIFDNDTLKNNIIKILKKGDIL